MRFIFGRGWVYQDETNGEGTEAGGGAAADDTGAAGEDDAGAVDDAGAADQDVDRGAGADGKKVEGPKDMLAAIDAGLGYKKGPNGEELDPLTGKPKAAPDAAGEKKTPAGAAKESETHWANGKPKKSEKGEALDDKGQVVKAPKAKTAAELDLKPDQLKLLKPETQARFREVIGALKEREAANATLTSTNKQLSEARDAILGVMQDTNTTQEQLGGYLEFNRLLHSSEPKDLEAALGMIENQRAALYKALGREPQGGGLDLLADFPDLAKQVDDEEITRAAALEIAKGRRERATRDSDTQRQQQQQRTQQQGAEQRKAAGDKALADIEAWTSGLAKSDLDYKAKEDRLLSKLDEVLKNYSPDKWLATLQLLYGGIEIQKAPAQAGSGKGPLRPSGARPGAKAPATMQEAIDAGLGYAGAAKG